MSKQAFETHDKPAWVDIGAVNLKGLVLVVMRYLISDSRELESIVEIPASTEASVILLG